MQLLRYPNIEEEIEEMLRIGMACVDKIPERRPKIFEVVKMIEEIKRAGSNRNRPSLEIRSEGSTSPVIVSEVGAPSKIPAQVSGSPALQTRVNSAALQSNTDSQLQAQVNLAVPQSQDDAGQKSEEPAAVKSQEVSAQQTQANSTAVQSRADSTMQMRVNSAVVQSQVDSLPTQQLANANIPS